MSDPDDGWGLLLERARRKAERSAADHAAEERRKEQLRKLQRPACFVCQFPITGKVYYQGGSWKHPVHKDCRMRLA